MKDFLHLILPLFLCDNRVVKITKGFTFFWFLTYYFCFLSRFLREERSFAQPRGEFCLRPRRRSCRTWSFSWSPTLSRMHMRSAFPYSARQSLRCFLKRRSAPFCPVLPRVRIRFYGLLRLCLPCYLCRRTCLLRSARPSYFRERSGRPRRRDAQDSRGLYR